MHCNIHHEYRDTRDHIQQIQFSSLKSTALRKTSANTVLTTICKTETENMYGLYFVT